MKLHGSQYDNKMHVGNPFVEYKWLACSLFWRNDAPATGNRFAAGC